MTLSRRLALFSATVLIASGANGQEVYGPSDFASEASGEEPVPLAEPEPCEEEVREDGAIVVCRELPESERYMSPLPRPVEVHINDVDGLRQPPCWVNDPKPPGCFRFGYVPPYPPLIDMTAFPEPLSAQEAAAVSAVSSEAGDSPAPLGRRVTIDLSEED